MAYNQNIPQPTDQISQSQSQILGNFQALKTLIDIDHVDFASGNQGKHNKSTYPVQAMAPAFVAGEVGIFNLLSASTAVNELNVTNSSGITTAFTSSILSTNAAPALNSGGWTLLPSGIHLKMGNSNGVTGAITVTYSTLNQPAFNGVLGVIVIPYSPTAGDVNFAVRLVSILSTTQFSIYVSSRTNTGPGTGGFQFLAIGY